VVIVCDNFVGHSGLRWSTGNVGGTEPKCWR